MIQSWHIWVIIALLCFIAEIFTSGFAVACLSIGALPAAIGAALHLSLLWQIFIFAVFTFAAFVFLRPFIMKTFYKPKDGCRTNAGALVGKHGRVSADINPAVGYGRVAIDGDDWKAVSTDGSFIAKGTAVEVVKIESIILTVKSIQS